jgi:hypothetical protein
MDETFALFCPTCQRVTEHSRADDLFTCGVCGNVGPLEVGSTVAFIPAVPVFKEQPVPNDVTNSPDSLSVPVSPTGKPVIPPATVPYLLTAVGFAAVLAQTLPPNTIAAHICHGIVALAGLFGIVSPGLRK